MILNLRRPSQSGVFYPTSRESLLSTIQDCFTHKLGPGGLPEVRCDGNKRIIGVISPHAGYIYSGYIAAFSYKILAQYEEPKTAIIIGPNHTGIGSGISIMTKGEWETPLGRVKINENIAAAIVQASSIIDIDDTAHQYEHSIEVQIPFLQYLFKDKISIVPISMMMQDIESSIEIATAIFKASNEGNMVIIASSDMTHYEKQLSAEQKDKIALDCIIKLDIEGLYKVIDTNNISMCGYGPIAVLMNYAQLSKVTEVRLEAYRTSGDVSKDYTSVVGYASVSFKK
jgi:hypothetical protein